MKTSSHPLWDDLADDIKRESNSESDSARAMLRALRSKKRRPYVRAALVLSMIMGGLAAWYRQSDVRPIAKQEQPIKEPQEGPTLSQSTNPAPTRKGSVIYVDDEPKQLKIEVKYLTDEELFAALPAQAALVETPSGPQIRFAIPRTSSKN